MKTRNISKQKKKARKKEIRLKLINVKYEKKKTIYHNTDKEEIYVIIIVKSN